MLTRTLFTLGSIRTFSFSLRAIVRGLRSSSGEVWASISGTLCLSDVWEAKLDMARAAVRDDLTHCRYGRSDWDYSIVSFRENRFIRAKGHTMVEVCGYRPLNATSVCLIYLSDQSKVEFSDISRRLSKNEAGFALLRYCQRHRIERVPPLHSTT